MSGFCPHSATGGNYYSNSFSTYSSNGGPASQTSTSTLSINGYYIRSTGIAVSATTINNIIRITLNNNYPIEYFDTKTDKQEIMFTIITNRDQKKTVTIKVPANIKMDQIKIERKADSIVVTGPSGGMDYNYSSSSFGGGAYEPPRFQMPPIPMPGMPPMPRFPPGFPFFSPFGNNNGMWMF